MVEQDKGTSDAEDILDTIEQDEETIDVGSEGEEEETSDEEEETSDEEEETTGNEEEEAVEGSSQSNLGNLSVQEKLQMVINLFSDLRWSFKDFLAAWTNGNDARYLKRVKTSIELQGNRKYRTQKSRRRLFQESVVALQSGGPSVQAIQRELDVLIKRPFFDKLDVNTTDFDTIDFRQAYQEVKNHANHWERFIRRILENRRATWSSYQGGRREETLSKRIFAITSIACHSRHQKRSNFLQTSLDIYLLGSGTKRRVMDSIAGFGLCHSYFTANAMMQKLQSRAVR